MIVKCLNERIYLEIPSFLKNEGRSILRKAGREIGKSGFQRQPGPLPHVCDSPAQLRAPQGPRIILRCHYVGNQDNEMQSLTRLGYLNKSASSLEIRNLSDYFFRRKKQHEIEAIGGFEP